MPRPEPTVRVIELRLSGRVVAAAAAAVEYCAGQHEDALAGAGPLVGWAVEALGALHLRPTVIKKRLEGGVAASSLELLTLLEHEAFDME